MPCGVWAAPSPSRSTVPPTRSPSIRLSVSVTGTTGIAAPRRAVARATALTSSLRTSGRAPSWTSTGTVSSTPRRSKATNPANTDSWRRDPPTTTSTTFAGNQDAPAISARRSGEVTTTSRSTSGAEAKAARVQARRGRPPISASSLSGPSIRLERPAATTTPSARTIPGAAAGSLAPDGDGPLNRSAAGRRSFDRPPSGAPVSRPRRGRDRCAGRRPRPRSSFRRRGTRRPGPPPCLPG